MYKRQAHESGVRRIIDAKGIGTREQACYLESWNAVRAIFFLIISALCHSLFYGWAMRAFPSLRTRKKLVLGILGVLVVLVPVGRIIVYRVDSAAARVITAFAMVGLRPF